MAELTDYLSEWLDPVGNALNEEAARRLLELRADDRMQARMDDLADRNTEGVLTPEERLQYERLVVAASLINVLKGKARARLAPKPTAA